MHRTYARPAPGGSRDTVTELREAVDAALGERRPGQPAESARPLEFDEGGFPIYQPLPTLVERVGRLLGAE
jgi:hypothetical protein